MAIGFDEENYLHTIELDIQYARMYVTYDENKKVLMRSLVNTTIDNEHDLIY